MPEIKHFPKMRIAFVTSVGPFDQSIPDGLEKLFAWADANRVQAQDVPLTMFPDDPDKVPAEKLRSEVGIPVGPEVQPSGEVQIRELDAFDAVTTLYNRREDIDRVYGELYGWLHAQGYEDAGAPMETYLNTGANFAAEVIVPVRLVVKPAPKPASKRAPAKKGPAKKTAAKKQAVKRPARNKPAPKSAKKKSTRPRGKR